MSRRKSSTNRWGLVWNRLGEVSVWGWGLFWYAASVYGLFTYLMDFLRTGNPTWGWLLTYSVSLAAVTSVVLAYRLLIIKYFKTVNARAIAALICALIAGGIKNFVVVVLAVALGIDSDTAYGVRFIYGSIMGFALLVSWAGASAARTEHAKSVRKLLSIQRELLGARDNLEVVLADEVEKLQERARDSVLPQLRELDGLLVSETDTNVLIGTLKDTVQNRLRPLMEELSNRVRGSIPSNEEPAEHAKVSFPKEIRISDSIRPFAVAAYTFPMWIFEVGYFVGYKVTGIPFVASVSYGVLLWVAKIATKRVKPVPRVRGMIALSVIAFAAHVPGQYFIGGMIDFDAHQSVAVPIILLATCLLMFIILTYLFILDTELIRLGKQIADENSELAKEQAIFEQKLWVAKRSWQLMLHGTVQAALTAAHTRLQTFTDNDPYQAALIRSDLERAEAALTSLPKVTIDFDESIAELQAAWKGVCAIIVDVDMRAERALKLNQGTAYCVNEIVKEAVGNAVRHGGAKAVHLNITREADDILDVRVSNDGSPIPKNWRKGIGGSMLDETTIEWNLESKGKLTTLSARLPI